MTDAELVKAQDFAAGLLASVLLHNVANLEDFTVLDAMLAAVVVPAERTVILAAWERAKLRRALDARNIILPAYSLAAP